MVTKKTDDTLVEVRDLRVVLPLLVGDLIASDGLSFTIRRGSTLGLVGESGCGKSIAAQSIMRIAPKFARTSGQILFHGENGETLDVVTLHPDDRRLRKVRGGDAAMVFQEPMTSFSPVHTIGDQILETVYLHRTRDRREARQISCDMLARVGFPAPDAAMSKYPHHLSGGMRQRAMIAMALASQPRLLIADEPTTALDVTVQAQVLRLLKELQRDLGMAMLYITHDLGVIARTADDVAVMYMGSIVEHSDVRSLFAAPRHPYTKGLMSSIPRLGLNLGSRLTPIPGNVPVPINKSASCGFFSRCGVAIAGLCDRFVPPLVEVAPGQKTACFQYPQVRAGLEERPESDHAA